MDLGKVAMGVIIGSGIGAVGAIYAMTSPRDRAKVMKQGGKMLNKRMNQLNHFM